ncbi:MAG TPA: tRNA uridine-5-carboxymethylaminomethyl(34) synthesis GTPase MnmE [Candidatus Babeliales bacterium]|jgi:tRNA modification GTPase|nr:tRNA uridine-5-carboxymethylaminomethyl(34) synthesis GTPase MnmE [Candidatus Babeliales bacterium]
MLYSSSNDAIIAQCTPQGTGAIALLRLSGDNAFQIAGKISNLPGNKKISDLPTHTIHYGWVVDNNGTQIDQVLFLLMRAPHTFTGDNTVEITCHNNPFIIQNIIQAALVAGARLAQEGEFSRRAVNNNKIDILQAEAINDLIHANTQLALKQSLSQLEGSFSHWITTIEKQLIKALALSDASFEFLDEENMEFSAQIREIIDTVLTTITNLKNSFNQQQQIRNGIRVAIIGSVNAGKSSLFNALLNQERAIVTNIAGTTRDAIEAGLYKNDNYWTLIDTAGLRTTDDIVEQMGIARSHEEAHKADIILLVFDGSQQLNGAESAVYQNLLNTYNDKIIIVTNKADLPQYSNLLIKNTTTYSVSNTDKSTISTLESAIQNKISSLFTSIGSPFLLNQRHYNNLLSLETKLMATKSLLCGSTSYELVSYHLQDTLTTLSELTGKTITEAGMDAVFREFCIGK